MSAMIGAEQKMEGVHMKKAFATDNRPSWKQGKYRIKLASPNRSVSMKLFLVICSILLLVLTQGYFSYYISKDTIKQEVSTFSEGTVSQAANKLDLFFSNIDAISISVYLNEELRRDMEAGSSSAEDVERVLGTKAANKILSDIAFSNNMINGIVVFDLNGNYRYGSVPSFSKNVKNEPWFRKSLENEGQAVWVETNKEGIMSHDKPTFATARVIKDVVGKAEYVLLIDVPLKQISDLLQNVNLGKDAQVELINEDHQIIYDSNVNAIGSHLFNILQKDENGKETKQSDSFEIKNKDGKNQLVVYSQSNVTGWYLAGIIPTATLGESAGKIRDTTMIMAIVALFFAIVVGLLTTRMIGRPLNELRNLMKEGEMGNLQVSTNFRRTDEIGQVGESFNRMMEQINNLVKQTSRSAMEVLATAEELSEASKSTAASAKEIAQATEEIASGSANLASEAERGNELTLNNGDWMKRVIESNTKMGLAASEVHAVSDQGTRYMGDLITKTGMTEEMIRSMAEKVDRLKDSTRSIRKILDVLNNMTKQTNILSLNATIEAARAGAAGKGFMVVADEIRKLADQSRQSISVVGEITDTIQKEIDETVEVLMNAYPIFKEQIISVKEADQIFNQVRKHMNAFVVQLDDVTNSIGHLDESQMILSSSMSSFSAFSEQSSAASQEVASLSIQQLTVSEGLVKLSDKLENLSCKLRESLSRFLV
jgi:methyl-accepting chemotaxis protein